MKAIVLMAMLWPVALSAQNVLGKVINVSNDPLTGASVYWSGTSKGVSTGQKGEFEIASDSITDMRLIASFVGYEPDTVSFTGQTFITLTLRETTTLSEVTVKGERPGVIISDRSPIKIEQITQTELGKAACCDLAGCFETQSTVQPQTTNVVTNSTELRILGLSGVYNQVLIDGFPMIQGLTYTYGISSVPGSLVDNIYVSKGANSVLQGFESISGQINVETIEPDQADKVFLNLYLNSFLEKQLNASFSVKKGKWSNLTAFHTTQPADRTDRDDDNFLDLPLLTRYMVFNKLKYGSEQDWGWHSKVGVKYLNEQRIGGQTSFNQDIHEGSSAVYGQSVHISQPEIWTKTGYRFNNTHAITLLASALHQDQQACFGTAKYDAQQTNAYGNIQYEMNYAAHNLKTGVSYRHLSLNEDISFTDTIPSRNYAGNYKRAENIIGAFAENTMQFFDDRLTWILGLRVDHHNQFGAMLTPRTLIKYNITPRSTIRGNIGTGWRTANVFSENINLLASSRDVIFTEELQPEKALNLGVNFTQKFDLKNEFFSGHFSMDFYRTNFQNQIFPDYDFDPTKAIISNFEGTSISNGYQAEIFLKVWQRFEVKTGYNYLDVYRVVEGEKQILPFNPKHKIVTSFSYKPLSSRYHFDMNVHWYGEQRLPDTKSNPPAYQRPDFSEPYTVVNAQFTYRLKRFEVYFGCENIFDFRQLRPIISWEEPFGPFFDTSSVWGPTRGRELYLGFRYKLARN